jgi:hypothetical protein
MSGQPWVLTTMSAIEPKPKLVARRNVHLFDYRGSLSFCVVDGLFSRQHALMQGTGNKKPRRLAAASWMITCLPCYMRRSSEFKGRDEVTTIRWEKLI